MYLLAAIPFALSLFWLVVVVYRLRVLNNRLRSNLAGCAGYPISPSFRRPVCSGSVPLSVVEYRAAGRYPAWCWEEHKSGAVTLHVLNGARS